MRRFVRCRIASLAAALAVAAGAGLGSPVWPEPTRVTEHVRGGNGHVVFDDLFRQAGLDRPTWLGDRVPERMEVNVERQPFCSALFDLCNDNGIDLDSIWGTGEVRLDYNGGGGGQSSWPVNRRGGWWAFPSGPVLFAMRVEPYYRNPALKPWPGEPADATTSVCVTPLFDPAVRFVAYKPLLLRSAMVDGRPLRLLPVPDADRSLSLGDRGGGRPWPIAACPGTLSLDWAVPAKKRWDDPEFHDPYRHRATVSGVARYLCVTRTSTVTITDLNRATAAADPVNGVDVRASRMTVNADRTCKLILDLRCRPLDPETARLLDEQPRPIIDVVAGDAVGRSLGHGRMLYESEADQGQATQATLNMTFTRPDGVGPPNRVTVTYPLEARWIEVPFEAKDLPTP